MKVALGEGANPPTRVGALTLNTDEKFLQSAVIDTTNGYAYFGTNTSPGLVVKVALGTGNDPPTRVGALTLNTGENSLQSAVIDTTNGYAYFGTWTDPGIVVKVALGAGANPPTRVGALTLNTGENYLYNAVIDTTNGYAYFGTYNSPGIVVKVALGEGNNTPTRTGAVTLNLGENGLGSAVIDTTNGYAYFGTFTNPGIVVKVALGTGANPPTRVGALTLNTGETNLSSAVIDSASGYAYFGTSYFGLGIVVKVALGEGNNTPTRVSALTLNTGEQVLFSAVIDALSGHAYFGTVTGPGRVVKVALGEGANPPTRVGALTLNTGEKSPQSAVIDAANGYAYFWTDTDPGRVVKVALGEGANPPTRVGALTLNTGEKSLQSAVIDAANGYAYFGTTTYSGRVVKVALGEGANPPTRVGAATLYTGEKNFHSAVIDTTNGYAYFGTSNTSTGRVVKVALGEGANPPTRVGAVTLNTGENHLYSAVIDTTNGYAYFGTWTDPGIMVKVALGEGANPPTRVGAVTLNTGESRLYSAVIDTTNGYAYFGTGTSVGRVVRVGLSQKGFFKGTKFTMPENGNVSNVSFYSHAAAGNIRLALYDNNADPTLLWQSASTVNAAANSWLTVPVSSGMPSLLLLTPGTYWLGWQVDTAIPVPSYTTGATGDGLFVPMPYGSCPVILQGETSTASTLTDERWSEYITYNAVYPPTKPTLAGATAIGTDTITWMWQDNSDDETGFKIYAGAGVTPPDTVTHTTVADVESWEHTGLDVNTQYALQVAATNAIGDSVKTDTITAWTLAAAPLAPIVSNATLNTLDIAIGTGDGNPAYTEYTIYCETTSQWIQPDGSMDATAAWQTAADWDATTITGLDQATLYTFLVRARNGASVETTDGPTASMGTNCSLTYVAGANGTIDGNLSQDIPYGTDGTPVTAVASTDYRFYEWSDGLRDNPRTDTIVTEPVNVTATFILELLLGYSGPNPLQVLSDSYVEMTVQPVNAEGSVYYQWYRIVGVKSLDEIPGAQESTLVLDPVSLNDDGRYICIAQDDAGTAQSPEIQLIVESSIPASSVIALLLMSVALSLSGMKILRRRV